MQSQEDDDEEVVYDVDFDRNKALAKSFERAREVRGTSGSGKVPVPAPKYAVQVRQQGLMAAFIEKMKGAVSGDEDDEEEEMNSILTFQSPVKAMPKRVEETRIEGSSNENLNHAAVDRRQQRQPSHLRAKETIPTIVAPRVQPVQPVQEDRQNGVENTTARKALLSETFGLAAQRPSTWSAAAPVAQKKRVATRKHTTARQSIENTKKPKVYESTHHHRSMAEVLSQATMQAGQSQQYTPQVISNSHSEQKQEDIEDAGMGVPMDNSFLSPSKAMPSVLKRKDSAKKDYHILGQIGVAIQSATRKFNRDMTLFQSKQHEALHLSNPSMDLPQYRPFITICILRHRTHASFAILTAFVHSVSNQDYFAASASRSLKLAPKVFVDAVFPINKAPDRGLIKIYAPLQAIPVDGNYQFPLLLGTHLYEIMESEHHCDATLPSLS
ncbi:hypothetical protein THRCLA_08689 [Thraustotheca clavata]|uniref:Uncharacterized protein n=1 Tax=Thraustotheca clavata TaxID=74557 RepID=A0A1V9Z396_9STRA|nr:hypothetical protein THRCLA_08689 [Thraustotheca clavata]